MSQENVEVLRAFYKARDAGDMDGLRELHDPSVIMHHPSGWPEPGPEVGRDAVMRQYHRLRYAGDAEAVEPIGDFIDAGDRALLRLAWHMSAYGWPEFKQMCLDALANREQKSRRDALNFQGGLGGTSPYTARRAACASML